MQGDRTGFREDIAGFRRDDSGQLPREVQASEAKTHLPQLLDEVERGATIVITRHGRRIARLVPEAQRRQQESYEALDAIIAAGSKRRCDSPELMVVRVTQWPRDKRAARSDHSNRDHSFPETNCSS